MCFSCLWTFSCLTREAWVAARASQHFVANEIRSRHLLKHALPSPASSQHISFQMHRNPFRFLPSFLPSAVVRCRLQLAAPTKVCWPLHVLSSRRARPSSACRHRGTIKPIKAHVCLPSGVFGCQHRTPKLHFHTRVRACARTHTYTLVRTIASVVCAFASRKLCWPCASKLCYSTNARAQNPVVAPRAAA